MSKSTISIRVEEKLFAQFCNAAVKEGRAPVEVLLEFIRKYVSDVRDHKLVFTKTSTFDGEAHVTSQRTQS